ncbi:MAG: molybdopterin molybdotransferase MoeA [Syntrophaceae bacterium]|nr:molybdopterin molybdotransferase MoeA [Syntrophaceae bacterium]
MIFVDEALNRILNAITPLGLERVGILDALGRVLGEDVAAPRNIPPKDNSAMDGYALRWKDTFGASPKSPVILKVIEDLPAGAVPKKKVGPGQATRIMTGAPLPAGADAVLRVEDTEKDGNSVRILVPVQEAQDIRRAGEDVREGETVIRQGEVIRPAEIGMLASLGRSFVSVHQRPLVAILATGDELAEIDEPVTPWKIISSNSYSSAAQVAACGAVPLMIGIARDTREDLTAKFRMALRADVILSSGGVSMGDYDLVKDILRSEGNRIEFWQVAMRPGKPLAFGEMDHVPLFGLPGNPVSSMVSFEQFVRPSLLKMAGHRRLFRKTVQAVTMEDIRKGKGVRTFLRARLEREDARVVVRTTGEQGSGILKSMVQANGLIVIPEDITLVKAGSEVTVQVIDDGWWATERPEYL